MIDCPKWLGHIWSKPNSVGVSECAGCGRRKAMRQDYWVIVCDKCLTASCWHGEFICQQSQSAGVTKKLASELKALNLEHPSHYSRKKLIEVCGCVQHA